MLPKGKELERMMATSRIEKRDREEAERLKMEKAAREEKRRQGLILDEKVRERMAYIERDILREIEHGESSRTYRYGDGKTPEPIWEIAVERLKRENRDYSFEIKSIWIDCNNYSEAANVDYVSPREWSEPVWELKITW